MSKETKFRPTYTRLQLNAIAQATTEALRARVNVGDFDSPLVKQLSSVKKYTERFLISIDDPLDNKTGKGQTVPTAPTIADKLRELGLNDDADALEGKSPTVDITSTVQPTIQLTNAIYSPLDNPNLTDDEKFDALCLKDEALFTLEEQKFFLNVGTFIRMRRAAAQTKQVNSDDL